MGDSTVSLMISSDRIKLNKRNKNKIFHRFYYHIFYCSSKFSLSFVRSRKTVWLSEQIMPGDKYPNIIYTEGYTDIFSGFSASNCSG